MAKRAPASNEDFGDLFGFQKDAEDAPKAGKPRRQKAVKVEALPKIEADTQFFAVQKVALRYDVSPATIWRWVSRDDGFPKPIKLSPGTSRWSARQLLDFESNASKDHSGKNSSRAQKPKGKSSKGTAG